MPDWRELLRARLHTPTLDREHAQQVRDELAGHLEDAYQEARRRGCTEEVAVASALQSVPDWAELENAIDNHLGGRPVTHTMRTLWIPGLAASLCAALLIVVVPLLAPPAWWADSRAWVQALAAATALACYVAFGAMAAAWSRRAGAAVRTRLWAGLFPVWLHLAILVQAIAKGIQIDLRQHPAQFDSHLRLVLVFVVVPGVMLALGAAPFLRRSAPAPR